MELVKLTVPAKQGRTRLHSGHLDLIDLHVCIYIYGSCDQQNEKLVQYMLYIEHSTFIKLVTD